MQQKQSQVITVDLSFKYASSCENTTAYGKTIMNHITSFIQGMIIIENWVTYTQTANLLA